MREFVATAYRPDDGFGLLTDTLAVTGARPSQAVRLRVEDLHDHPVRPKLMMPKSAKVATEIGAAKKLERYSVPITMQLATRLREVAKGRADDAPLLLQSDGSPWGNNPGAGYHRQVARSSAAIGARCRRDDVLRCGIPAPLSDAGGQRADSDRGVAAQHLTKMIEKHYSKYIAEHSDDISRAALLQP